MIHMYQKRYQLYFLFLLLIISTHKSPAICQDILTIERIHPNIDYVKYQVDSSGESVVVHMVLVEADAIRDGVLIIEPVPGGETVGQCATPSSSGGRSGAVAAINGPYFASAGGRIYPLGFMILDGFLAQLGNLYRPLVGFDREGNFQIEVAHPRAFVTSESYFDPVWLWGVNTPCGSDMVTMYDRDWGISVGPQGGTVVSIDPLVSGESDISYTLSGTPDSEEWFGVVTGISTRDSLEIPENGYALVFHGRSESFVERYQPGIKTALYTHDLPSGWEKMYWVVMLGPWFIHDGHFQDYSSETSYGSDITGRANRSVIGLTWNDEIFFAVTRGAGLNVMELADVLIDCNVREAVMCDSGGSSGLWVDGIGAIGSPRAVPISFIVREATEFKNRESGINIWPDTLIR